MALVEDVATHKFTSEDRLFFDANIWIFLYGPQGSPHDVRVRTYSLALKKILNAGSKIFVDVTILSEFANRYARISMSTGENASKYASFKEFRDSPDFEDVAPTISTVMNRILEDSLLVESGLAIADTVRILSLFETGKYDFNDLIIGNLCAKESFVLVTDDSGFQGQSLSILTSNGKMLAR